MEIIDTPKAPRSVGHYSQGIVHNGCVYVAGQLPNDPEDRTRRPSGIEAQTEQALKNVEAILVAAGSSMDKLLSVTVYVSEIELWSKVNKTFARVLGEHRPARSVVPVTRLHGDFLVEIQAVAAV